MASSIQRESLSGGLSRALTSMSTMYIIANVSALIIWHSLLLLLSGSTCWSFSCHHAFSQALM